MEWIQARENQYVKLARAVQSPKGRRAHGCYPVEGVRLAEEALAAGLPLVVALFADGAAAKNGRLAALAAAVEQRGVRCLLLPERLFAVCCDTEHPQGVLLLARLPQPPALSALPRHSGCWAYADQIRDPGNLGTIIRSARAAGVDALLLAPTCADVYQPKTLRAAMGAAFQLPLLPELPPAAVYDWTRQNRVTVLAADAGGADVRTLAPVLRGPHLWVLGAEADGLTPFWRQRADHLARLPMAAGSESLNVAAAAAVLFYQSLFAREGGGNAAASASLSGQ